MRRRPGRAPSIAYLCKFAKLTEISKEDLILLALPHISSTVQLAVNRGLCKAANCKISSKSNSIDVVAEFVTLWQMIAVLGVVTTVACCFFLWTAMLIRANLVAWPLAIRERRLKVVRDNDESGNESDLLNERVRSL
uniref:Uncharacterized protein n=1 Tax=Parascaris univalens TaxID=6257 RepID=A0A915AV97_PARUN